jgi:AcrR family transcriptional regulator
MTHNDGEGDLRVRRTRKLLRDALIALTGEKGFAAVTVGDITARAMVNRATFYRHYQDKYDLIMAVIREVLAELGTPGHDPLGANWDEPLPAVLHLFEHMAEHAAFYRGMLSGDSFPLLERQIRAYVEQVMRQRLSQLGYAEARARLPYDLCIHAMVSTAIGMITWWLEHGQPYSARHMAVWLPQVNMLGLHYCLGVDAET